MPPPDLRQDLRARGEQQMLLQPRMLQSIEVLQLAAPDLEAWLQGAAAENEALRVEAPEWAPSHPPASREATERHDEMLRNHPDRERGLAETLEEQLCLLELDDLLDAWVRFLIPCLDSNGYLSPADEELLDLAARSGLVPDPAALGLAIARLQRLEPRGIGGRDMTEALLLQLDPEDDDYASLCRLLEEFLEDVAANRLPRVARALGIEPRELDDLLASLRRLDPRPGASMTSAEVPALRPDVVVERDEAAGWSVRVERSSLPSVSLDPQVVELARDRASSAEIKSWARDRVERARWIVDAVRQRRQTLLRVSIAVFERQVEFLERGPGHLRPLRMGEIAEDLELHLSTVSRAVSGKHVQTPAGVFPLRFFFQQSVGSEGRSARSDVRELVRQVIAAEDPSEPLSDEEVVGVLVEKGVKVARRTVAKYRKELGIAGSYRRKRTS